MGLQQLGLVFLVVLAITVNFAHGEIQKGYVYLHQENGFQFRNTRLNAAVKAVAWGQFDNKVNLTGWAFLEIATSSTFEDSDQAYAAGLLEGQLTREFVANRFRNQVEGYCKGRDNFCKTLRTFLDENLAYMNDNIAQKDHEPYWHQVSLVLKQAAGIDDGVKNVSGIPRTNVDVLGTMFMDLFGDLEDLEMALSENPRRVIGSGSCSALVKVLEGNSDIYFAHDTWNTYNSMLRINKKYSLKFKTHPGSKNTIPGHTVSFSSYPAGIFSGDDFYLISSGLAVMETTNSNNNATLAKQITPNSVFDWVRNIVANRLARTGREWTKLFKLHNSGTYNNQFMILDYKLFKAGQPLAKGLLWIAEQMPGYMVSQDVTDVLKNQSYWPSYNTPYSELIYNVSDFPSMVKKYGDWFTYDKTPRALIFKREQRKVVNLETMTNVMRYNDYTKDPLSKCNCTPPYSAENAIAARCDLNDPNGVYPFGALGHRSHGATDMKLTNYSMFKKFQFIAISGPSDQSLPSFKWSTSGFNDSHYGHPDLFDFKPIIYQWSQ